MTPPRSRLFLPIIVTRASLSIYFDLYGLTVKNLSNVRIFQELRAPYQDTATLERRSVCWDTFSFAARVVCLACGIDGNKSY